MAQGSPGQHVAHRQHEHGGAEREANEEPARHVDELRVRRLVRRGDVGDERLQGHAAFGTRARPRTPDFGVHRARINGAGIRDSGFGIRGAGFGVRRELFQAADLEDLSARSIRGRHGYASAGEIPLWIGLELLDAPFRAEVIRRPLMLDMAGGARRIDAHSAHRINVGVCHFRVPTGSGWFRRRARMRSDARSTRASRSPPRAR